MTLPRSWPESTLLALTTVYLPPRRLPTRDLLAVDPLLIPLLGMEAYAFSVALRA